jgi:uncharacterized protein (DUF697 family)
MSRTLEIDLAADAEIVVEKARGAAKKYGAEFTGDRFAGRFSGNSIEGHYRIEGRKAHVTIERKPDFAPWPMVEKAIRGFFEVPAEAAAGGASVPSGSGIASRRARADRVIKKHVIWSTGAGLIPIPIADLAAVTAVQVSMLEELAVIYGVQYSESVLKSFVTALTGGMAARLGASALKAIPGLGSVIGGVSMSVMSGASTYGVGQVARRQFDDAADLGKVDLGKAKRDYKEAYEQGKDYVSSLEKEQDGKGGPDGKDGDTVSKLERLAQLRDRGVLTEDEFQAEKKKLLSE